LRSLAPVAVVGFNQASSLASQGNRRRLLPLLYRIYNETAMSNNKNNTSMSDSEEDISESGSDESSEFDTDVIDWDEAMEQCGDDEEFLRELLADLRGEISAQIEKMDDALEVRVSWLRVVTR
jgi:hypothetical protein